MILDETHRQILASLSEPVRSITDAQLKRISEAAEIGATHWDFSRPAQAVDAGLRGSGLDPNASTRRAVVARFALMLPAALPGLMLPKSVLELYPRAYDMLVKSLTENGENYDLDFYAKDVRLVLGLSVPAGAQFVDLRSPLGAKIIARQLRRPGGIANAFRYAISGGRGRWLQIHTDTRDVADFDEAGWDRCYKRIAELLERDPDAKGMIGNSWFYDPSSAEISPRLAYLHKPFKFGALRIWSGFSSVDLERAAAKSPTRAAAIAAGTYRPNSHILAWPRKALIKWAGRN